MRSRSWLSLWGSTALLAFFPSTALSNDILKTDGFSNCGANSDIQVKKMDLSYDRGSNQVNFDVAGVSAKEQKVMATLIVMAYGNEVYRKEFDPCDENLKQMCPIPKGEFAASGNQSIPQNYISQIPGIAFSVPNLDGQAKLELKSHDTGADIACIQSVVNNGKTFNVPAAKYVAAGVAGAALLLSGLSALSAAGQPGAATPSPTFGEVVGWFQSMAMNGMLSVQYPAVYRSFTENFGFSGLLISWTDMQQRIDDFRGKTGGNLTADSIATLKKTTLVFEGNTMQKRSLNDIMLFARDVSTSVNGTSGNSTEENKAMKLVHGVQGYVEELTIPQTNTFMTVLLIFAVVIAAIIVGILLFKVILETWALFGSFPKRLTGFRKRYWWTIAKTCTNLILLLYGVWVLYCVYQFKLSDSWATKVLAGVTLGIFTAILAFFTFKIWSIAHKFKKLEGDASALYENKDTWIKYSIFYDSYKRNYWWLFVPAIVYMLAKGCVIAGADGKGLVQSAGQLIIEALLLVLLLWSRPYSLKSGNWINIFIQVVRVLSVVCILVFVEELGVAQSTKTITGVVLIVMQSVLTGLLAILIAVNAIIICCKDNPHRRKRKEAEKLNRDLDNLTPLDARNSLLMESMQKNSKGGYTSVPPVDTAYHGRNGSNVEVRQSLLNDAASIQGHTTRSISPPRDRAPRLPDVEMGSSDRQYYGARAY